MTWQDNLFCVLAPAATNVIRQGSKALPTLDDRGNTKKANGDNRAAAAKGGSVIDKERIVNIDTLNPYMNKFVSIISFNLHRCFYSLDGRSKHV